MLSLTFRGLRARKLRSALTALAIFFGVAMIVGTLMLTDTIGKSFDDIFENVNASTDVTVKSREVVEDSRDGDPPAFDAGLLQKVLAVDGVAEAAGSIFDPTAAILDENGDRVGPMGPPHFAASTTPVRFSPWSYPEGRVPTGPDEVAIDSITAKEENFRVGERVRIAAPGGAKRYRISGIGRFADGTALGGASIAQFTLAEAQRLTRKRGKFDEIVIAAEPGVPPEELKRRVQDALPASVDVRTGEETAQSESQDIKDGFAFFSTALLVFAAIALLVGGFLIFNTFSITVSQRTREFGMLRTLGASARQVLGTVLLEALIIGLVASVLGIMGGIGFVVLLTALFEALGFELPTSGLVLTGTTIAIAIVVGVVSTTLASVVPAVRATRVTPLEALREHGRSQLTRQSRRRTAIAVALLALGVLAIGWGLFGTESFANAFQLLGPGLVLVFIAVAMLSSRVIRPLASFIGWPIERLRGVTGRLARENTLRNPSRTTTTAAALMIGLALVTFVATFAAALTKSFDDAIDQSFAGDLILVNTDGFSRIPGGVPDRIEGVPGVQTVSPIASADGRIQGDQKRVVSGIEPGSVSAVAKFDWVEGSNATLSQLGTNGAIAESDWAKDSGVHVGDTVVVRTPTGKRAPYVVRGTARDEPGLLVQSIAIPRETLARDFGVTSDDATFVSFEQGVPFDAARERVDAVLKDAFPNVESRSQDQLKEDTREQINQLLVLIYALLALSIVVSLFGIVNTLILTIHERTREIGMLRAIGTSRRQVRQMIRYESVITAMIGAIIGAGIGLLLAIVAVKALEDEGFVLSVPYPLLVVLLLLAGVAGVAAAIAPARRASKINVMEALQYE